MTLQKYPRIHLTMDNCFAIKRWAKPSEWTRVIKEDIGKISCVQASTDLEIDPQFCPKDYTSDWINEVKKYEKKYGINLVSFYSGYVTYRSTSLLNWDKRYRDQFLNNYIYGAIDLASEFGATAGGALQAYTDEVLQNPEKFEEANAILLDYSVKCAKYAQQKGVEYGFEQMYTPTQGLWRIKDVKKYIRDVFESADAPIYTTIDTAHMAGQDKFFYPTDEQFISMIKNNSSEGFRLPDEMKRMVKKGTGLSELKKVSEKYEYWFSILGDENLYRWVEEVSCYSPIIHLQQTDGSYSAHKPFTKENNQNGIVNPQELLKAIVKCYDTPVDKHMPARVKDIYLAFEIFFGITDSNENIISALKETVEYWRSVIHKDGEYADFWLE